MPLKKFNLVPGLNKQATASQAEGQWIEGDNIRFRYGSPEKIGGWSQLTSDILVGAVRAQHSWADLTGRKYAALGTDKILYIYFDNTFYDITPLDTASALTACTFDTTSGLSTVTVNKASHGLDPGDLIVFTVVTAPPGSGYVAADFTTNTFEIQTTPTTNTFTIKMATNASGTTAAAGSATCTPYYFVGPLISTLGYGWGAGTWGLSTWGTARTTSNTTIDAANWSLDNYGELLIATIRNSVTFSWDPNAGTGVSTRATLIPNNPTKTTLTLVSDRDRHLIHFGTEAIVGDPTSFDPMLIRFSDQEDLEVYEPTSTNTAGSFRLDNGTRIICAVKGKDYVLVLTDNAAYTMQFVGPPFTFSIRQVASNCGAIGQHGAIFANGMVFWMGDSGGFFVFDGTVKDLPSLVEDFVFTTIGDDNLGINYTQGELVFAGSNNLFEEVQWFYPKSGSNNIDRVVTYNYVDNTWSTGTLARTTWNDASVFTLPYATKYDSTALPTTPTINGVTASGSYYFAHETGVNEILQLTSTTTTSLAISAYVRSGDFDLDLDGDGEYFTKIRRFIPDFKNLEGTAKVTIYLRAYPADTTKAQGETYIGPFTISTSTDKVDTRARARLVSLKIENDALGDTWRYGVFRVDIQPDGRR